MIEDVVNKQSSFVQKKTSSPPLIEKWLKKR